jgi:hypothetical protein
MPPAHSTSRMPNAGSFGSALPITLSTVKVMIRGSTISKNETMAAKTMLIRKIQTMRKEAGFEVMDRIKVYASGNEKIQQIMLDNKETIAHDVLADEFIFGETAGYTKNWKINSEPVTLGVEKQ